MHPFEYQKVSTLSDAVDAIADSKGLSVLMAGGTDLLLRIKEGVIRPERVIDMKGIPQMSGISISGDECIIGTMTSIRALETSSDLRAHAPLLGQAASKLGSVQVRNRATIGGNLCNAAPSAETAPALLALDAQAEIFGRTGTKIIDLQSFFIGPGSTVLEDGEILTALKIPLTGHRQGAVYYNLTTRNAMDIAFVGVAVLLELDDDDRIDKARIALGAVAPTPIRAPSAEKVLEGRAFDRETVRESGELAARACQPISDLRASAAYRREMVRSLCRRGVRAAYDQAKSLKESDKG
ncbi:MAG: FAD binding domain-containing protein [Deltaproteobacteria bacterium]|nr:FAD binding domain-containing protein [Deltaproteobacteria bacterium]